MIRAQGFTRQLKGKLRIFSFKFEQPGVTENSRVISAFSSREILSYTILCLQGNIRLHYNEILGLLFNV